IPAESMGKFEAAMDVDFNLPVVLGALFTFVLRAKAALDALDAAAPADLEQARRALLRIDEVLGVLGLARKQTGHEGAEFARWVEERIAARPEARRRRALATADAIRSELAAAGVIVEDTPRGTRWKRA